MNIASWLERAARTMGSRAALWSGTDLVADYAGFFARASGVAGWLKGRGLMPGDRVAIFMRNHPDYLVAKWGAWIAGLAVVPINARLHGAEAAWIIGNAGAKLAFVSADLGAELATHSGVPQIAAASPEMAACTSAQPIPLTTRLPTDLAWLFYTSGTTGQPKGVQITHGMITAMSLAYPVDVEPVSPEDAAYYAGPMSHGAGIYGPIHVLKAAGHIAPPSEGFDPAELLEVSAHHGSTSMFLAPTMVKRLTDHAAATGQDGTGIRTIIYGGGPMYVADLEAALDQFGEKFVQIYGQGECPMAITALPRAEVSGRDHPDWPLRAASVGRAQSNVDLAIADANGTHLPPGADGEILVRGLPVMPGYWENPEGTAKAIRDGWLWTGDIGRLDENGYLTLVDRSKDLIISGGSNVYPREVEEAILTHASVAEVSVVGRAHPDWGEEVVAFIVPAPGARFDPTELEAHCNSRIGRYKRPKAWFEIEALPKNNYGKVLKTELRARLKAKE